jgi:hypothetical protein
LDTNDELKLPLYLATPGGIFWIKRDQAGLESHVRLSNFQAKIVADISRDDGAEITRAFEIESTIKGHATRFRLPASKFGAMNWVHEQVGASAVITAVNGAERKLREAIPSLSGHIQRHHQYGHTGGRAETMSGFTSMPAARSIR